MLRINRKTKSFLPLENLSLTAASITERGDLQEYIWHSPEIFFAELGEELFLLGKEITPSSDVPDRIDLLKKSASSSTTPKVLGATVKSHFNIPAPTGANFAARRDPPLHE